MNNCESVCPKRNHSLLNQPMSIKTFKMETADQKPIFKKKKVVLFIPKSFKINNVKQVYSNFKTQRFNFDQSTFVKNNFNNVTNEQQSSIRHSLPVKVMHSNECERPSLCLNKENIRNSSQSFTDAPLKNLPDIQKKSYKPIRANIYVNDNLLECGTLNQQKFNDDHCHLPTIKVEENVTDTFSIETDLGEEKDFTDFHNQNKILTTNENFDRSLEKNLSDAIKQESYFQIPKYEEINIKDENFEM